MGGGHFFKYLTIRTFVYMVIIAIIIIVGVFLLCSKIESNLPYSGGNSGSGRSDSSYKMTDHERNVDYNSTDYDAPHTPIVW